MCSASQLHLAPLQELNSHVARGSPWSDLQRGQRTGCCQLGLPKAWETLPYAPALKIPLESLFKVLY